jgi:hypothetical protein
VSRRGRAFAAWEYGEFCAALCETPLLLLFGRTRGFGSVNLWKLGPYPANEEESNASTIFRLALVSPRDARPALASVESDQQ